MSRVQVTSTRILEHNHTSQQHRRQWETNNNINVGSFFSTTSYHLKQWDRKVTERRREGDCVEVTAHPPPTPCHTPLTLVHVGHTFCRPKTLYARRGRADVDKLCRRLYYNILEST
ncbi:hypothetical protein J6590_001839 [Homalodisca vitripennis]|nr:hypothetical protein J6590_001839 [Homalodisca vitripennis]